MHAASRGGRTSGPSSTGTRGRGAAAAALYVVTLGYFVAIGHVDLAPWNALGRADPQLAGTLVGVVPGVVVVGVLLRGGPVATGVASLWPVVWWCLQVLQWWVPYVADVHPLTGDDGRWYVEGGYEQTLHLLPVEAGRVVPDCQHLVLQALTLGVACACVATARARRARRTASPERRRRGGAA